jgi:hypothetical protein
VAGIYNRATYAKEMGAALERGAIMSRQSDALRRFPNNVGSNRIERDVDALTFYWLPWQPDATSPKGSALEGVQMPQYFFAVRAGDCEAERTAELKDDAAALAYACEIVRELVQSLSATDHSSLVQVRDETRPRVFSIPFFPACA